MTRDRDAVTGGRGACIITAFDDVEAITGDIDTPVGAAAITFVE